MSAQKGIIKKLATSWVQIEDRLDQEEVDAVIAFTMGQKATGALTRMSKAIARVSVSFYTRRKANKIVFVSGGKVNGVKAVKAMKNYVLDNFKINEGDIRAEFYSGRETLGDVANAAKVAEKKGFDKVLLVAHELHLRRCVKTFLTHCWVKNYDFEVSWGRAVSDFDPDSDLSQFRSEGRFIAWEFGAFILYRFRGKILNDITAA